MSPSLDQARLDQFIDEIWDRSIIPTLCEYTRIPNKSAHFDPQWEAHVNASPPASPTF
ncbi:MAG TPA: hypothetical protein VK025_07520 [Steroidobacter sp.]|jgi:hypothetical protein|nr:hypothetical protein [Steroidobacteraceae bacterium]HLS81236.1 hypothetical protein [Steroidobacter sp.]